MAFGPLVSRGRCQKQTKCSEKLAFIKKMQIAKRIPKGYRKDTERHSQDVTVYRVTITSHLTLTIC